jgi:hypothetical protein
MATTRTRNATIDHIATLITAADITSEDLRDITDQIDNGADPTDWTGRGEHLHLYLLQATEVLDESAFDLVQSAENQLGW